MRVTAPGAWLRHLAFALALAAAIPVAALAEPPAWAYPIPTAGAAQAVDNGQPQHVPGSTAGYTKSQLDDFFAVADWHPQDHGPLPDVVAHGRGPDVYACGYCHRADGAGGPENARLAGLPFGYILQQLADFRSGARRTAVAGRRPQALMMALAKALDEDDARAAAAYFSTQKPRRVVRVSETNMVPRTVAPGWFLAPSPSGGTEPIAGRIIEVPDDVGNFERRDTHATFTAYVPPGSIAKGAAIVAGAAPARTPPCATCHGAGLRGQGNIPGIAGRSPSYLVRQLVDIQTGARNGQAVRVMKALVARLDGDDLVAIAAYVASLEP